MESVFEAEYNNGEWHHHPIFQRFWTHYTQSCNWYKHHLTTQQLLWQRECCDCFSSHDCQNMVECCSHQRHKSSRQRSRSSKSRKSKRKRKNKVTSDNGNETSIEMEVTEEFFKFLEETEKHRQQQESEKLKKIENAENLLSCPPKCREITSQRSSEMKFLYGTAAAKIHGMETAMQLTFNRYSDLKQPKPWPNIPLNM